MLGGPMMVVSMTVFHLTPFLQAVNDCTGSVWLLGAQPAKVDLHRNPALQQTLCGRHAANGNYSKFALNIPQPRDYLSLVQFYASNC